VSLCRSTSLFRVSRELFFLKVTELKNKRPKFLSTSNESIRSTDFGPHSLSTNFEAVMVPHSCTQTLHGTLKFVLVHAKFAGVLESAIALTSMLTSSRVQQKDAKE